MSKFSYTESRLDQVVDRVIGVFSPRRELNRKHARHALSRFGYDAAMSDRLRESLEESDFGSADRNRDQQTLETLREIGRNNYMNNAIYNGIVNRDVDNVVGTGFTFQMTSDDEDFNTAVEKYMTKWSTNGCDVRGLMSFWQMERACERALINDGDIFFIKHEDGGLQAIEGDRVVTPTEHDQDPLYKNGVEMDRLGKPIRYHVAPYDKDGAVDYSATFAHNAEDVIFVVDLDRFSATRGVPALSPSFDLLTQIDKFIEAVIVSARIAACQGLVFNSSAGAGWGKQNESGEFVKNTAGKSVPLQKMRPGMVHYAGDGETITQVKPEQPSQQFEPFLVQLLRIAGTPMGMPLELILLDFSRTTYSSARASLLQAYKAFRTRQKVLVDRFLDPTTEWKMDAFFVDNPQWSHRNNDEYRMWSWEGEGWEWVDPKKESEGADIAYKGGQVSMSTIARKTSVFWKDLLKQRTKEIVEAMRLAEEELDDKELWTLILPQAQAMVAASLGGADQGEGDDEGSEDTPADAKKKEESEND